MRNEIFLSLLLGFLLDCLVGDPHSIPHPVVLIGKLPFRDCQTAGKLL